MFLCCSVAERRKRSAAAARARLELRRDVAAKRAPVQQLERVRYAHRRDDQARILPRPERKHGACARCPDRSQHDRVRHHGHHQRRSQCKLHFSPAKCRPNLLIQSRTIRVPCYRWTTKYLLL